MKKDTQGHLDESRILKAFIDRADLSPSEREHLDHCDACERSIRALAGQLRRIGDEARKHTPASRVQVSLPAMEATTWLGPAGKWIAGPALAAACIALLVVFFQPGLFTTPRPFGNVSLAAEAAADALLMAEIDDIQQGGVAFSMGDAAAEPAATGFDEDENFFDDLIPIDTGVQS